MGDVVKTILSNEIYCTPEGSDTANEVRSAFAKFPTKLLERSNPEPIFVELIVMVSEVVPPLAKVPINVIFPLVKLFPLLSEAIYAAKEEILKEVLGVVIVKAPILPVVGPTKLLASKYQDELLAPNVPPTLPNTRNLPEVEKLAPPSEKVVAFTVSVSKVSVICAKALTDINKTAQKASSLLSVLLKWELVNLDFIFLRFWIYLILLARFLEIQYR